MELIDSYRFFYESSRYLAGFPKAYLLSYYAAHWETAHCKYLSQKTIAFWAMSQAELKVKSNSAACCEVFWKLFLRPIYLIF